MRFIVTGMGKRDRAEEQGGGSEGHAAIQLYALLLVSELEVRWWQSEHPSLCKNPLWRANQGHFTRNIGGTFHRVTRVDDAEVKPKEENRELLVSVACGGSVWQNASIEDVVPQEK